MENFEQIRKQADLAYKMKKSIKFLSGFEKTEKGLYKNDNGLSKVFDTLQKLKKCDSDLNTSIDNIIGKIENNMEGVHRIYEEYKRNPVILNEAFCDLILQKKKELSSKKNYNTDIKSLFNIIDNKYVKIYLQQNNEISAKYQEIANRGYILHNEFMDKINAIHGNTQSLRKVVEAVRWEFDFHNEDFRKKAFAALNLMKGYTQELAKINSSLDPLVSSVSNTGMEDIISSSSTLAETIHTRPMEVEPHDIPSRTILATDTTVEGLVKRKLKERAFELLQKIDSNVSEDQIVYRIYSKNLNPLIYEYTIKKTQEQGICVTDDGIEKLAQLHHLVWNTYYRQFKDQIIRRFNRKYDDDLLYVKILTIEECKGKETQGESITYKLLDNLSYAVCQMKNGDTKYVLTNDYSKVFQGRNRDPELASKFVPDKFSDGWKHLHKKPSTNIYV